ncbi:MAG: hypothetical protein QOE60_2821 [Thermoleophilaceae bacterium]|nr:hypothetical protein [Thermoleophilaceae bacterium]
MVHVGAHPPKRAALVARAGCRIGLRAPMDADHAAPYERRGRMEYDLPVSHGYARVSMRKHVGGKHLSAPRTGD